MTYGKYLFPIWADVLGNLMCVLAVSGIFIYIAYDFIDVIRKKRVSLRSNCLLAGTIHPLSIDLTWFWFCRSSKV